LPSCNDQPHSLSFSPTNSDSVSKFIKNLKSDCATGPDLIPAFFIKLAEPIITPHITNILNSCIQQQFFPDNWKLSRISPVPKINNPSSLDDYRPISILPVLSKIFEKVLATQILSHIDNNNIYPPTLSGCRKGHSTITSLHLIRDTCIRAMKSSELTILTLIDFSKAFDTLNYNKLLALLSDLNFSSSSIKLISSYLTNRKQFISFSNQQSDILKISNGVPQGSILGPILFNIYISSINIKSSSSSNTVTNYVDDFQVAASCKPSNLHTSSNQIKKTGPPIV